MKISTVTNKNNLYFGYNREYHEKLHEKLELKKRNQAIAHQLIEADFYALELEDEIVRLEKSKKTNSQAYRNLVDLLTETREVFANNIDKVFPELKYCQNASDMYISESKNTKNKEAIFWREYISAILDGSCRKNWVSSLTKKDSQEEQETHESAEETAKDFFDQITQQKAKTDTPAIVSDLISLYEPTEYSPKSLDDVIGMDNIKTRLQDEVLAYIEHPELETLDYEEYGIRAPRGYLLYGPPGCGKTFIVSALAAQSGVPMYKMDVSKVGSKYVNQTSKNLQEAFDYLAKTVKNTGGKAILFMDEVDSLAKSRSFNPSSSGEDEKTVSTLLKNIEAARDKGIIVFAATNRFDSLDEAFKSRFDGQYYIGLPDTETIEKLIQKELSKKQKGQALAQNKEEIRELAKLFKGHSNRAIVMILDEAAKNAKKDNRNNITSEHIKQAIKTSELEKPNEKSYIPKSKKNKTPMGFNVVV